jgi:hypothetical protein
MDLCPGGSECNRRLAFRNAHRLSDIERGYREAGDRCYYCQVISCP